MKKVKLRENALVARIAATVLRSRQMAIVFGDNIYLHNTPADDFKRSRSWVLHELKHVEQYEEQGTTTFLLRYIYYSIKYGYHNNPFEKEARNAESDTTLLHKYSFADKEG